jgi:hypothetical protein
MSYNEIIKILNEEVRFVNLAKPQILELAKKIGITPTDILNKTFVEFEKSLNLKIKIDSNMKHEDLISITKSLVTLNNDLNIFINKLLNKDKLDLDIKHNLNTYNISEPILLLNKTKPGQRTAGLFRKNPTNPSSNSSTT